MPFKLNQDRRHHIPKQTHRVTNWPAYDAALRRRGSLTITQSFSELEQGDQGRHRQVNRYRNSFW